MAHFAELNKDNTVTNIIVISNCAIGGCIGQSHWDYQEEYHKDHGSLEFPDQEPLGITLCKELYGEDKTFVQTSYNGKFRGRFAGAGMTYDPDKDEFVSPEITA